MSRAFGQTSAQPRRKTSARTSSLVTGGGLLLQQGLGFIGGVFVAKLLGPADYGQISVLRSILTVVLVFTPLGLDLALFSILPRFDDEPAFQAFHFRRFRLIALAFGLLTVIVGASVAGPLLDGRVFNYSHFALNFGLTLLAVPIATDVLLMTAWYRVHGNVVPILIITSYFQPIVRTVLNVLAVYQGYGVIGVVVGTGLAYIASFMIAWLIFAWTEHDLLPEPGEKAMPGWSDSWALFLDAPAMALNLFAYAMMRGADMTIVGSLASARAVGEYAVVSNIAQLVPVAATSLMMTLGPTIARLHQAADIEGIRQELNRTIRWSSLLSSFVFGGVAGFGMHLDVIFGRAYQPGAVITVLIPLGYLMSAVISPASYALTMSGRSRIDLACIVAAVVLLVSTCIPLTRAFGVTGASISVLIAFTTINLLRLIAIRRAFGIWVGEVSNAVPPVVALVLAFSLDAVFLPRHTTLLPLISACLVYALAYGSFVFRQQIYRKCRQWRVGGGR